MLANNLANFFKNARIVFLLNTIVLNMAQEQTLKLRKESFQKTKSVRFTSASYVSVMELKIDASFSI